MIRQKRQDLGLTQSALADRLAVDQTTVSQWERGVAKPRADKLLQLAEIFSCTVDELLRESKR